MIKLNGHVIVPTIFPDNSSQVWKIPKSYFHKKENVIKWEFENEGEFMQLAQLKVLLDVQFFAKVVLDLPYLPYARQDKEITNESTFALYPFSLLLNSLRFNEIRIIDPHNVKLTNHLINNVKYTMPNIKPLLKKLKALPVYPDVGAAKRYDAHIQALRCEKIREPLTGAITDLKVIGKVKHTNYLIQDDLIDGGRTFIEVAKKLYEKGAKNVYLYGSHGIFSKGLQPLLDVGIRRIFTYKGEVVLDSNGKICYHKI